VTAPDPLTAWFDSLDVAALLAHPTATGASVRVALIDTGVDGAILQQRHGVTLAASLRFVPDRLDPLPVEGPPSSSHGTTVADVILSLAPRVELYSADVFGARGTCEVEALMRALRLAMDSWHCHVINLSLGVSEGQLVQVPKRLALLRLMDEAYFRDVMVVAAAGNDHPLTRSYPAAFGPPVFGVDRHEGTGLRDIRYAPRERIEFAAPARAYFGPLASFPATSWATPHVTGVISQLLALRPGLRPFEIKALLARGRGRTQ
jgi:subtilisin family serine protease